MYKIIFEKVWARISKSLFKKIGLFVEIETLVSFIPVFSLLVIIDYMGNC